jgi:hypothetical protein
MVRDAPKAALLTMRVYDFAATQDLILRRPPKRPSRRMAAGETALARLLTMRVLQHAGPLTRR